MKELDIQGISIAPDVIETIVSIAALSVDGVVGVGDSAPSGLQAFFSGGRPSTQGVDVSYNENMGLQVSIRLQVNNGQVLPDLASKVRLAIADAISSQVGVKTGSVDIYIDGILFNN